MRKAGSNIRDAGEEQSAREGQHDEVEGVVMEVAQGAPEERERGDQVGRVEDPIQALQKQERADQSGSQNQ